MPTPTFIFYIEAVWKFSSGGIAVSGRMVEGHLPGPCHASARLADSSIIPVAVLGVRRARTSRLERALTLEVSVEPEEILSRLEGAYLLGRP